MIDGDALNRLERALGAATLPGTPTESLREVAARLDRVLPNQDLHLFTYDASLTAPAPEGGLACTSETWGDYMTELAGVDPLFRELDPASARAYALGSVRYDRLARALWARPRAAHELCEHYSDSDVRRGVDPYTGEFLRSFGAEKILATHVPLTKTLWLSLCVCRSGRQAHFRREERRALVAIGEAAGDLMLRSILSKLAATTRSRLPGQGCGYLLFDPSGALLTCGGDAPAILERMETLRRPGSTGPRKPRSPTPQALLGWVRRRARAGRGRFASEVVRLPDGGVVEVRLSAGPRTPAGREALVLLEAHPAGAVPARLTRSLEATLSPRELQVARLVTQGRSLKEAARRLGIGRETVKTLLGRACRKLGVSGQLELAAGLLDGSLTP